MSHFQYHLAALLLGFPFLACGQLSTVDLVELDRAVYTTNPPEFASYELDVEQDKLWLDSLQQIRVAAVGIEYTSGIPTLRRMQVQAQEQALRDAAMFWEGVAHHKNGDNAQALVLWEQLYNLGEQRGDSLLKHWVGQQLGNLHESAGTMDGSRQYLYPALNYHRTYNQPFLEASVSADLGGIAFGENNWKLADSLYNRSISIYQDLGAARKVMRAKMNLNSVWLRTMQNSEDSVQVDSLKGLQAENFSSIERINQTFNDSLVYIDLTYYRDIFPNNGSEEDRPQDLKLISHLKGVAERNNNERKVSLMQEAVAYYYYSRHQDNISAPLFGELWQRYDSLELWGDAAKACSLAADSYSYVELPDSVATFLQRQIFYLNKTNSATRSKASAFYEARFRNQDQARQLAESELQSANRLNYLLLIGGISIVALLLALLAYRHQRTRRKTAQLELAQQEQEAQQEVQSLLERHRYENLVAQIQGEESERDRLAKEIHDGVGGVLAGIALKMESEHGSSPRISDLTKALRQTHDDLRNISHNLALPALEDNSLVELSKEMLAGLRKMHGYEIGFTVFPDSPMRLDPQLEVQLYRVLQELTNNIVKHADASQVEVSFTLHPDELNLIVADNGKGFDPATVKNGLGQRTVRERVAPFGGTVRVESTPGNGTTATVVIPDPKRREA